MDQGLYASWFGTAMTALTATSGFLALFFPQARLPFAIAASVFFVVAIYSFWKAMQARRRWPPGQRPI